LWWINHHPHPATFFIFEKKECYYETVGIWLRKNHDKNIAGAVDTKLQFI
jgi:hypothetical protein